MLIKLEEKYAVRCVHCHWDFGKAIILAKNLFWGKEPKFNIRTILQKLINFALLMNKCYRMVCIHM